MTLPKTVWPKFKRLVKTKRFFCFSKRFANCSPFLPMIYLFSEKIFLVSFALISPIGAIMKQLKQASIVTVCASCKKILSHSEQQASHSEEKKPSSVSHGLCLECIQRLYPEIAASIKTPLG